MDYDHPFTNQLIIEKIFQYIPTPDRLKYLLLTRKLNTYLFNTTLVEFSIDKYLVWLISSKSYEPLSFTRLLYWKMAPMYIPSKIMDNLECLLQFLHMEHFKRVRVVLSNRQIEKYQISAIELSNRMSVYLILNDLSKYFNNIEELIIRGMTIKCNPITNLKIKYLDLEHTKIDGDLPITLETLIIDIGILEQKRVGLNLPQLKNIFLSDSINRIRTNKYLESLDWVSSMPRLEMIVIGHSYFKLCIDLSRLIYLKKVFYLPVRDPCKFVVKPSVEVLVLNSTTKNQVNQIFQRQLINQQSIFNDLDLIS